RRQKTIVRPTTRSRRSMQLSRFSKHLWMLAPVTLFGLALQAAPIDLSILNPNRPGVPGGTYLFQGTIANDTGGALNSTDLFLNFSAFDAANVTLDQVLGSTNYSIPNGSTSAVVDLYTFALAGAAPPATYFDDVVLETADGDFTPPQTVSVGINVVPEPGSLGLAAIGGLAVLLFAFRKRTQ